MIEQILRAYCRAFHRSILFAGGTHYTCRRCGLEFENPAINGPAPIRQGVQFVSGAVNPNSAVVEEM